MQRVGVQITLDTPGELMESDRHFPDHPLARLPGPGNPPSLTPNADRLVMAATRQKIHNKWVSHPISSSGPEHMKSNCQTACRIINLTISVSFLKSRVGKKLRRLLKSGYVGHTAAASYAEAQ
jgi:hypothetical protein